MTAQQPAALVTGAFSASAGARLRPVDARVQVVGTRRDTSALTGRALDDEVFVATLAGQAADTFGSVDVLVLNHGLEASARSSRPHGHGLWARVGQAPSGG